MSESELTSVGPGDDARHPIHVVVTDDLRRNRLTVFFRLFLAIPHFIWAALWAFLAYLLAIVAWVVGLVLGRVPDGIHKFLAGYTRYQAHVYAYFSLAANPFTGVTGSPRYPGEPVKPWNALGATWR